MGRRSNRRHNLSVQAARLPLPPLSCRAWAVADADSGALLLGDQEDSAMQVASMSKVVTALVVLRHCENLARQEAAREVADGERAQVKRKPLSPPRSPARRQGTSASPQHSSPARGEPPRDPELQLLSHVADALEDGPDAEELSPAMRAQLNRHVTISRAAAAEQRGTHADLKEGEIYTVKQMLYALLLPSGNDAAIALAEHFGDEFAPNEAGDLPRGKYYAGGYKADSAVGRFVGEMNRVARAVCCGGYGASADGGTQFVNPHGMSHGSNLSSAADIAKLSHVAMTYPIFRRIVATERKTLTVRGRFRRRTVRWDNTNALLALPSQVGSDTPTFDGVKTGWIPNVAGQRLYCCLCVRSIRPSCEPLSILQAQKLPSKLILVVVGSRNKSLRFVDANSLAQWAWRRLGFIERPESTPQYALTPNSE